MTEESALDVDREASARRTTRKILGLICSVLLLGVLYAGLKPFHAPANQVAWVVNGNAVRFGEHGTILSSGSFPTPASGGAERSLEIWVQPGKVEDSNTLLAFYDPAYPRQVSINQAESDLEIRIQSSAAWRSAKANRINIGDAFRDRKRAFWAVTFGQSGTAVYRDGVLVRSTPIRLSGSDVSGRLVVGNSPIFDDSWTGVLSGLAIYNAALNGTQIARHYQTWTTGARPVLFSDDLCIALYLFNEHAGQVVHNRVRPEHDLYIPLRYMVLRQTVLDPIWRAFNWSSGFWKDAFINIAGFVPFGCFFCAYFSVVGFRRPALLAATFGGAVSALIELTQTQLPTRDSSMSDLINNILGSVLGVLAYRTFERAIRRGMSWVTAVVKEEFDPEQNKPAD